MMRPALVPRLLRCLVAEGVQTFQLPTVGRAAIARCGLVRYPSAVDVQTPSLVSFERLRAFSSQTQQQQQKHSGTESSSDTTRTEGSAGADAEAKVTAESKNENEGSAGADAEAKVKAESNEPEPQLTEEEKVLKQVEELEEKLKAKKHELLLAFADFENNKKRYMKERESRRRNATINFSRKMVEVYSEFEAFASEPAEALCESGRALREGIVMTKDAYKAGLTRMDIDTIAPEQGQPFVSAKHDDVGTASGSALPANSVAEIVQTGWELPALKPSGGGAPFPSVVLKKARVNVVQA